MLSDAYVVLDWDDRTLAAKLLPVAATQRQPPGDAPRDVRRACIRLLSAALAWSEFRWGLAMANYRHTGTLSSELSTGTPWHCLVEYGLADPDSTPETVHSKANCPGKLM